MGAVIEKGQCTVHIFRIDTVNPHGVNDNCICQQIAGGFSHYWF